MSNTVALSPETIDAAIARGRDKVDALAFPFCVRRIFATNAAGMYGWCDDQAFFATAAEAIAFAALPFVARQKEAQVTHFVGIEPHQGSWRWIPGFKSPKRSLASRRRGEALKLTKAGQALVKE